MPRRLETRSCRFSAQLLSVPESCRAVVGGIARERAVAERGLVCPATFDGCITVSVAVLSVPPLTLFVPPLSRPNCP